MKNFRDEGGYSLALVLVVMLVLATIATTLATVVQSNISNQTQYTRKMQAQYTAQGELEKVISELSLGGIVELMQEKAQESAVKNFVESVKNTTTFETKANAFKFIEDLESGKPLTVASNNRFEMPFSYDFTLSYEYEGVEVSYDLQLRGNIAYSMSPRKTEQTSSPYNPYLYLITSPMVIHKSVRVGGGE